MSVHSIELPEEVYRRLQAQAVQLQITPEQVVERLLSSELLSIAVLDDEADLPIPPPGSPEALAAVHRLTSLLADVAFPHLDSPLTDPMIAQANADIDEPHR